MVLELLRTVKCKKEPSIGHNMAFLNKTTILRYGVHFKAVSRCKIKTIHSPCLRKLQLGYFTMNSKHTACFLFGFS